MLVTNNLATMPKAKMQNKSKVSDRTFGGNYHRVLEQNTKHRGESGRGKLALGLFMGLLVAGTTIMNSVSGPKKIASSQSHNSTIMADTVKIATKALPKK